eukprot:scaffold19566_cov132-Skeletonema_dohrnii-CCMP3373.AAC.3
MTPLEHAIMSDASLKTVKLLQAATSKGMQLKKESKSFMAAMKMKSLKVQDDFTSGNYISSRPRKMARSMPTAA